MKSILDNTGIGVTKFSGNSARPAATSYGTHTGLPLREIIKAGGWSYAQTFATYYNKPIETLNWLIKLVTNFGASILEHFRGTQKSA